MTEIEIIGLPQSNLVWAARIACAEKGAPHRNTPAPPHAEEIRAAHPLGKIPGLRHGAVTLGESAAIIDYLDGALEGPALRPADPVAAAKVAQWAMIALTASDPLLIRQYGFIYIFPKGPQGAPDKAAIDPLIEPMNRHLDVLETGLETSAFGGAALTVADCYLIPILIYMTRFPESGAMLAARPGLSAYVERSLGRPSVKSTMPPHG